MPHKATQLHVVLNTRCTDDIINKLVLVIGRLHGVKSVTRLAHGGSEDPIEILELSARLQNTLLGAKITTLGELTARTRSELGNLKNLGNKGLREIEDCLERLGLHLQPQSRRESVQPAEDLEKFMTAFNTTREALRRLWRAVEAKGYVTPNWQDWRTVDTAIRQYARTTVRPAGIEEYIAPSDAEPFLQSRPERTDHPA